MGQCNVQHAIDGLGVVEGCLFTVVDLTKQMKLSFAPPPPLVGGHVAVQWQQNQRKEGRKEGVCVCRDENKIKNAWEWPCLLSY